MTIISTIALVKWHSTNKEYYISKGYVFSKMREKFEVKVEDLMISSKSEVLVSCDSCNRETMMEYWIYNKHTQNGTKKYNCKIHKQEYYEKVFSNKGFKLLSTYEDSNQKLKFICPFGHDGESTIGNFSRRGICVKCSKDYIDFEDVKVVFSNLNLTLISESCTSKKQQLECVCEKGHKTKKTLNSALDGHGCNICRGRIRYTIEDVKEIFEGIGYKLITNNYINCWQKLEFICNKGHKESIALTSINNGYRCQTCSGVHQYSTEEVRRILEKLGLIMLTEEYVPTEKIKFRCSCGNEHSAIFQNIKKRPRCVECGLKMISGENHQFWKGGISNLQEHLRYTIKEWKVDSLKKTNGKCVISGKSAKVVHHIHGFDSIVKETLELLDLEIRTKINEYTEDELKSIEEKCIELHYEYGLGAPLTNKTHELFHSIYGFGNNTLEQFEEFKNNITVTV